MRYLCLMYGDGPLAAICPDSDAELRQTGNLVAACALDAGQPAITVKTRNGNIVASDGPLLQSACLLHTCVVIDARDLNDAIRITARIPGAERACIEIRPIMEHIAVCAAESAGEGKSIEHENGGAEAAYQTRKHVLDIGPGPTGTGTADP